MNNIMVDLETFGTDSNSVIVSISAVQFDMKTGEVGATFECGLNIKEQLNSGAIMDADTVLWWLGQDKEAQDSLLKLQIDVPFIQMSLANFTGWVMEHFGTEFKELRNVKIWGNGATFDNVILRNLYSRHDTPFPLPYWCDRDVRTAVDLKGIDTRKFEFTGVKHNGIDDCLHQIKYCTHIAEPASDEVTGD